MLFWTKLLEENITTFYLEKFWLHFFNGAHYCTFSLKRVENTSKRSLFVANWSEFASARRVGSQCQKSQSAETVCKCCRHKAAKSQELPHLLHPVREDMAAEKIGLLSVKSTEMHLNATGLGWQVFYNSSTCAHSCTNLSIEKVCAH